MDRRAFLKLSAALAGGSLTAGPLARAVPDRGFKVGVDEGHFQDPFHYLGGLFKLKISAQDTDGAMCIFDTVRMQKGGPGMHVHYQQDEWFYVIEGDFIFQIGEDRFELGPGDSALGPRNIPHAFAKVNEGEGKLLIVFSPAGRIEHLFKEAAAMIGHGGMPENFMRDFKELVKKYDIDVVGPPLKF